MEVLWWKVEQFTRKVELRILLEDSAEKVELTEVKVESSVTNVEAIQRKVEVLAYIVELIEKSVNKS